MEPRIQYAKTEDGVNIAFLAMGDGPAFVRMPTIPFSDIMWRWKRLERERAVAEALATNFTYVQYDSRGAGSSSLDVTDFSLEAHIRDLEAVVHRLNLERFALMGSFASGPVAIAYAVRYPNRLSRLIVSNSWARRSDVTATPEGQAVRALSDEDWTIQTEASAQIQSGWSGEEGREWAALFRESTTRELATAASRAMATFDVTDLLPQVRVPTLVVHSGLRLPRVEPSRSLAAQIPDARLVTTETLEASAIPIAEFLAADLPAAPSASLSLAADTHTILFTDMESSTALTQQLGDVAAQEVRRAHNDIVRGALSANGGSEIKHTGDGIMASFAAASSALDCAIAIQQSVAAHKEEHSNSPLGVYIGLNAGEPIVEDDDLFGTSINLAARICDHAEPGQILVSNVVRELAAGKDFLFADLGETELRGFEDPVKLWELSRREQEG